MEDRACLQKREDAEQRKMQQEYKKSMVQWHRLPLAQQKLQVKPQMSAHNLFVRSQLNCILTVFSALTNLLEDPQVRLTQNGIVKFRKDPWKSPVMEALISKFEASDKAQGLVKGQQRSWSQLSSKEDGPFNGLPTHCLGY